MTSPSHTPDVSPLIQARLRAAVNYNRWIHDLLAPYVGHRILDAGCGIGNVTRLFLGEADLVVGYELRGDFCETLRAEFAERANFRIVQGDLSRIAEAGLSEEAFDTVLCVNVLEHIEDDVTLLGDFSRLLAPGGKACLFVPTHPWLYGAHDAADGHFRRYTRHGLREVLVAAGFTVEALRWANLPGIFGWWLNKLRRCDSFAEGQCGAFDRVVPLVSRLEARCPPPVGLSLLAVGRKP